MKQRIVTAIFFAAAMLGGVYGGSVSFYVLFLVVTVGCLWEFTGILFVTGTPNRLFRRMMGIIAGVLPVILYGAKIVLGQEESIFPLFPVDNHLVTTIVLIEVFLFFALFIVELFLSAEQPFQQIGHYLTGVMYVGVPYAMLIHIAFLTGDYGPHRVFGIMWLVWTNDSVAYFVGSKMGKNKLFERISPKKTWEGTLGGVVGTLLMAWFLSRFIAEYTPAQWITVAVVAAIFGSFGDLVESMLKRSAGIKDSGNLFPGHGGFLDRFDAFQFAVPFAWAGLMLVGA